MLPIAAVFSLLIWAYLALFRDNFWHGSERLTQSPTPWQWPAVTAIIPARDEAETIETVVSAHDRADYRGTFGIIVVDDASSDGTGDLVRDMAHNREIDVIAAPELPAGWSGKLNAVSAGITQGSSRASSRASSVAPGYYFLTDADIVVAPDTLSKLVAKALDENLVLVSLMSRLDARGIWGSLLIPAFIYFFQKLYPFPAVNSFDRTIAGAAGGCMLVNAAALEDAGGIASIKGALIDDCALAERLKNRGSEKRSIWLGLADKEAISKRDNRSLSSIWNMVARTAFAELNYSPMKLLGTIIGMVIVYLIPPVATATGLLTGNMQLTVIGVIAWSIMALTYSPTLKLYGKSPLLSFSMPVAGLFYTAMTLSSAARHWRGRGGQWKGRTYTESASDKS
ncbi:MAG: glycosyltransferase [Pseudomonadota bacterium]